MHPSRHAESSAAGHDEKEVEGGRGEAGGGGVKSLVASNPSECRYHTFHLNWTAGSLTTADTKQKVCVLIYFRLLIFIFLF